AAPAVEALNEAGIPILSVDIPSGVNGATGAVEGPAVRADVTVAIQAEKLGTALAPGGLHAGTVEVVDIGIALDRDLDDAVWLVEANDLRLPDRPLDAHKRSEGSVALLAGSDELRGAALLAARGAIRMGCGYATLGPPTAAQ